MSRNYNRPQPDPTPEEIADRAWAIRQEWSPATERKRAGVVEGGNPIQGAETGAVTIGRREAAFILGASEGW